jgi:glycine betaine transporter
VATDVLTSEDRPRLGAVFYLSLTLAVLFIAFGVTFPDPLADALAATQRFVVESFGPTYLVAVVALLGFVIVLAVSPLGRVRLGPDDVRPEFGWVSWVAMLLSAGVGLSYLFWGTAEPLIHFADPPNGVAVPESEEAALHGMRYSFLFWGPHAWTVYTAVALAVGYSSFRHGRPMLVSAALRPLLGDRVDGALGTLVDVLAVFAILFGVATSLGLGTRELDAALAELFGLPRSYGMQIAIIVGLMTVSTISAMTGLGRGIRWLSLANVALCGALLLYVLLTGPTADLVGTFGSAVREYVAHLVPMSFATEGAPEDSWEQEWTFFFWAWWISWAPFVGTFLARISRGRTIRSVVVASVVVPSAISFVWFSVFGGTALQRERNDTVDVAEIATDTKAVATLEVLETLPLPEIVAAVAVAVLALLFVTSADSASFMLGSTTSGGTMRPPRPLRLMWSFSAAFAAVLLLSGGRANLQGAAVVAAVPFTVILVGLCAALAVSLVRDARVRRGQS